MLQEKQPRGSRRQFPSNASLKNFHLHFQFCLAARGLRLQSGEKGFGAFEHSTQGQRHEDQNFRHRINRSNYLVGRGFSHHRQATHARNRVAGDLYHFRTISTRVFTTRTLRTAAKRLHGEKIFLGEECRAPHMVVKKNLT